MKTIAVETKINRLDQTIEILERRVEDLLEDFEQEINQVEATKLSGSDIQIQRN